MKVIALTLALLAGTAMAKQAVTNIKIPKMDCDACAVVVKQALRNTTGVESTSINAGKRVVTVVYDDAVITIPELRKTIEGAGFAVERPLLEIKK
jgi:copper chaperone CopZ